jgi:hypothetical protein
MQKHEETQKFINVGIYSFPKSGNTWMRNIISSVIGEPDQSAVPDLHNTALREAKSFRGYRFYKHHGFKPVHRSYGEPVQAGKFIYIKRNPLDVFLSYLNWLSSNTTSRAPIPFDSVNSIHGTELFDLYFRTWITIGMMAPFETAGSYYQNNWAWMKRAERQDNVEIIRYEDLIDDPMKTLAFLIPWLGVSEQQLAYGLNEAERRTQQDGKFFWKKTYGTWREYLSSDEVDMFLRYRERTCSPLGYGRQFYK